ALPIFMHVAQVQAGFLGNQCAVIAAQAAEYFAQRPDGLAQQQHLALVVVDAREDVRAGIGDQLVLQRLDPVADELQHFEVMIHYCIKQRISQVVGPHEADPPTRAQAFADTLEYVPGALLEGQYVIRPQHQADLFRVDLLTRLIELQHAQHDIEIALIVLHLGPLIGIEDVFHHQWMQLEHYPQGFDHRRVADPGHIEPADLPVLPLPAVTGQIPDHRLVQGVCGVFDHLDSRTVRLVLADVHQGARWSTYLGAPFHHQFACHAPSGSALGLGIEPLELFPQGDHFANDQQRRRLDLGLLDQRRHARQGTGQYHLVGSSALLDQRDRCGRRAAMGNQLPADVRQPDQAHVEHHRLPGYYQLLPGQIGTAILEVPGDKAHRLGMVAVGQRNAGIGGAAIGGGDARHHLERNTISRQLLDLLPAPAADEGIAALEPQYPLALFRQPHQQLVDL